MNWPNLPSCYQHVSNDEYLRLLAHHDADEMSLTPELPQCLTLSNPMDSTTTIRAFIATTSGGHPQIRLGTIIRHDTNHPGFVLVAYPFPGSAEECRRWGQIGRDVAVVENEKPRSSPLQRRTGAPLPATTTQQDG